MKELVWAAIYICIGAIIALGLYALIACGATKEREQAIYREGFAEGHRIGLRKGKLLKIDKALVDEMVYGGPRRGGIMCELDGMRFKSAKIVSKDEAPMVLSCDRVDKAPGFDSIRPE